MDAELNLSRQVSRHPTGSYATAVITLFMSIGVGLLGSIVMIGLVLIMSSPAEAKFPDEQYAGYYVRKQDTSHGSLLLRTEQEGIYLAAPALKTEVTIQVTGMVARAKVLQTFRNPTRSWVEGVYVFPLPDEAAVDTLRMHVGDRIIEGMIKERTEAKRIYNKAKREGRRTSLVEQERPNLFSNSVANIGPGEEIQVEIHYQQQIKYQQGAFSLRFPMVAAPRYIPGRLTENSTQNSGHGWAFDTDQVKDASRITPPVLPPREQAVNPITMNITLNPGITLASVDSTYHKVDINREGGRYHLMFTQAEYASRDFELVWRPDVHRQPQAALFTERLAGEDYALLMVMPPNEKSESLHYVPREVTYVIDTSGSMAGASIQQARAALLLALQRLREGDYFNIIEFNSETYTLYKQPVPVTTATITRASAYVHALKARGGTEMWPALQAALSAPVTANKDSLRQVIFITDGSVGNEAELFKFIKDNIGARRLFTVGIGSAPNSHFMQRAASFGRGTYTYIGAVAEVSAKMSALFNRIDNPLLTDIQVNWQSPGVVQWPEKVADLYLGDPIMLTAKLSAMGENVVVSGIYAGRPWQLSVPASISDSSSGVNKLWARNQIASLMSKLYEGSAKDEIMHEVIDVALRHHLVSKYTSLVAVDVTPARPEGQLLTSSAVPVNLPEGWRHEAVFRGLPATATSANEYLLYAGLAVTMLVLVLLYLLYGFRAPRRDD